ncbi:MAG: hypothetical protein HZB91_06450, partial [Elusimicrobia bacterium]|nr:hypothetical protein [Elusimicrobiota bacterium]
DPAYAANGMLYYNGGTNKLRLYNGSWNDLATGGASGWTDDGAIVKLADQNDNAVVQSTLTVQGNAFSVGGSTFVVTGGSASVSGNMNLASDSGRLRFGSSGDVALGRDAADTLALARGVNPQEMRVYRTTDGTDSEFLKTGWNPAGIFQFTTGKTGAGSRDALYLSAGGTYPYEGLTVGTDGTFQFTGGPGATAVYIKAGLAGGGVALGLARLDGSMIGSILGDDAGTTEIRSQGLYNAFFGRTADALYRPLVIQEASTDAAAYYSRLKMGFGLSTDYFDIQAYQTSGEGTAATLALNPSGGNVGVGTTAPTHKLDVNGGAVVRSSITLAGISSTPNSVAGQGAIYFDTEDAKFKVSENAGGYQDLVAAAGTYVAKAGDSMTGQLTVRGASVEVSSITTFGAVGIGGVGLSGGTLVVKSTSTDPTNPVVNIQANNATEIMRVQQDGKVGVGTTNPSATLEVATGGTGLLIKNTADVVPFKIQEDHTAVVGYNFLEGYRFGEGSPIFAITRNGAGLFGGYTFGSNSGYAIYSSADMPFLAGSEGEVKFYGSKSGDATIPPASAIKSVMLLGNTSIAGGSANGTFLGSNPPSFSGNFVDFQVGGNRRFAVKSDGSVGIGAANPAQKVHMSSGTLLIDGDAAEAFKVGVSTFIINSEGRVGIGTTGPGEKLEVKGAVVQTASDSSIYQAKSYVEHRNLGTTAGDTTNIGTLHFPNGAGLIELDYTGQGAGYSIAAKYVLPVQYANIEQGFNGVWLLAQPVSFTGVYQIEDVNLDIRISAEDVDLRLRRVSGITDATHTMRVTAVGNTFTFTPDSGTGSGAAAPSTVFGAAVLTQRTGRVGIATTSP